MEHHNQGIKRRVQLHFRTTFSLIGSIMIIIGFSFLTSLVVFYPQLYLRTVFDSRLAYHLVYDKDDYLTCDKDYRDFIYDEPSREEALVQFYVFNITNPLDVISRGFKPRVKQLGPYAYQKYTYKYNVTFDPTDDSTMSFKEYVTYKDIPLGDLPDRETCRRMYYRMGRAASEFNDPCADGTCECQYPNHTVTVVNPSFSRTLKEEGASQILARLSEESFADIKTLLEVDFVRAVRAHTVYLSITEIFLFRQMMMLGPLLNTSFSAYFKNYTIDHLAGKLNSTAHNITILDGCGLHKFYNATGCPVTMLFYSFRLVKSPFVTPYPANIDPKTLKNSDFPDIKPLLDPNQPLSFLNLKTGLPIWIGIIFDTSQLDFNYGQGYTMVSPEQMKQLYDQIAALLALPFYHKTTLGSLTPKQTFATYIVIKSVAYWLVNYWIEPYKRVLTRMVYDEWTSTYTQVICTPLAIKCMWQFGYMTKYRHNTYKFSPIEVYNIIDISSIGVNNPNQVTYDGNNAAYYNTYTYCSQVYFPTIKPNMICTDYNYTIFDATVRVPGSLWAQAQGLDLLNRSYYEELFQHQSPDIQLKYFYLGCNMSTWLYEVYPNQLGFHDDFTVHYLNKYRDPNFNFTFKVGQWNEMAWAQYGGGYITWALSKVRSTFQFIRNGMWRYGHEKYYSIMLEYGSWAIYQGFPNLVIDNPYEAGALLHALAQRTEQGMALRRHIVDVGTTLIGNGTIFVNEVGAKGETAYIPEWPYGDFSCNDSTIGTTLTANAPVCQLLTYGNLSSLINCQQIETLYDICLHRIYFDLSQWVTNCARFRTSLVDPTNGIQCTKANVRGHPHPYLNTRGNIVYAMLQAYAFDLNIQRGLWCNPVINPGTAYSTVNNGQNPDLFSLETALCDFSWGGLFTTTTVNNLLFRGYTDPMVIKYLNLKHEHDGVKYECATDGYDQCGIQLYHCNDDGLVFRYNQQQNESIIHLNYSHARRDQFFAPYYYVSQTTGELLWPHSMIPQEVLHAQSIMSSDATIISVRNPTYTLFPAMNQKDGNKDFLKLWQSQNRILNGLPSLFVSEKDTLNTGRKQVVAALNIEKYKGNSTVKLMHQGTNISHMVVKGATTTRVNQHPMNLWRGFENYSYLWNWHRSGPNRLSTDVISLFHKQLSLQFDLSQQSIFPESSRNVEITVPFTHTFCYYLLRDYQCDRRGLDKLLNISTRRFVEDQSTWDALRALGKPVDNYGMHFKVPQGMVPIDNLVGFPCYISTPNNYGNQLWGGLEYLQTVGGVPLSTSLTSQNTFVDYEPVTGRALRTAFRHQINIRAETGPLLVTLATAQLQCVPPSKIYLDTPDPEPTGYGCWSFIPLVWFEDARVVNTETFYRLEDHFFTRPDRGQFLINLGMIMGLFLIVLGTCILIRENKLRRDFMGRIYVD